MKPPLSSWPAAMVGLLLAFGTPLLASKPGGPPKTHSSPLRSARQPARPLAPERVRTVQPGRRAVLAAPQLDVQSVNPGITVERDLCLTVSLGDAAAAECGDLRLVHSLPGVRTLNRNHTPVLVYSSQHAQPHPIVAAVVTLPDGTTGLQRVTGTLRVNGQVRAQGTWAGSTWPGSGTGRVAIGYDARHDPTGSYPYTLEITSVYDLGAGETSTSTTASGDVAVVNRRCSPFGCGWWLAGLEQLMVDPGGATHLWIGGDGSVRRYVAVPNVPGRWAAPNVDRPDTLLRESTGEYVRLLPGGVRVRFDAQGQHIATINRLGQVTRFIYTPERRLESITVPVPAGGVERAYRFRYRSGRLQSVEAPGAGAVPRIVSLFLTGSRVDSIEDPDRFRVRFGYTGNSARVTSRTDRRGHTTVYRYDAGEKIAASRLNLEGGDSIVTRYRAQESLGLAMSGVTTAVDTVQAYTRLDGPRTDVGDTTALWLNRWGAPRRIRDAMGHQVLLARGNVTYPALVTRLQSPSGQVLGAVYDARGNLEEQTDSSTYAVRNGQTVYATTRYLWDPKWDLVTRITLPEGEVTEFHYDPLTGNRLWQQDTRGAASRVNFFYNGRNRSAGGQPCGLYSSSETPTQRASNGARDSVEYDLLCNVSGVRTPMGFWSRVYTDALGRDTLDTSPIDSAKTAFRQQRTTYNASGLVASTYARAPAAVGATRLDEVFVSNSYDEEGNLKSVSRRMSPDSNAIGTSVTRWKYDWANRKVQEIAPDGKADSTIYDPAGNVTEVQTRRRHADSTRHRITLQYDALNRLRTRTAQAVQYAEVTASGWSFPFYGNGMLIPGEVATFDYDDAGHLIQADNENAHIVRRYNQNGTLRADTLRIRTWTGSDFTKHVYGIRYGYDLEGRRIQMLHPSQLAPAGTGSTHDTVSYGYDNTGQIDGITDFVGQSYTYRYDLDGRLDSLNLGLSYQKNFYDVDSRLKRRVEVGDGYQGVNRNGSATDTIHDDWLRYDGRGKVLVAYTLRDSIVNGYSGLGALVESIRQALPSTGLQTFDDRTTETYVPDPLGNLRRSRVSSPSQPASEHTFEYQPATGRQIVSRLENSQQTPNPDLNGYDDGGNLVQASFTEPLRNRVGGTTLVQELSRHYYDANNKLHAVDRRSTATLGDFDYATISGSLGAFEEYFYDALGRRVLTRSRQDSVGIQEGVIQRTVWDGDQILYEIRYPGGDGVVAAELEWDTVTVRYARSCEEMKNCGEDPDSIRYPYRYSPYYGRVAYAHGSGIDQPLSVVRIGYGQDTISFAPFEIHPHVNWRGLPDVGTFFNGSKEYVQNGTRVEVDWPGRDTRAFHKYSPRIRPSWMGNLITDKRDASGLLYMRNRYYDPNTGRFTQEDPIGLAGGLNVYGFANGDPVSYADPYGLCPDPRRLSPTQAYICNAIEAGLTVLGGFGGFSLSGGAGLIETGASGGVLAPVAIAQTAAGTAGGLALGKKTGEALTNVLFREGSGGGEGGGDGVSAQDRKSIRSLQQRISEHEQKLAEYRANPDAFDNQGLLKNAPSEEVRQRIINGRIRHLEHEIRTFQSQLDDIMRR